MLIEEIVAIAREVNRKYPDFLKKGAEDLATEVSLRAPPSRRQRELEFLSALCSEWRLRSLDPALAGTANADSVGGKIFHA
jgi:hypothetical protein